MRQFSLGLMAIITLFSATTATTAHADDTAATTFNVEPIVYLEQTPGKKLDPSVEGSLGHTFANSKFGLSGFWWVTNGWAEFHGGPTYALTPWLTVGADLGLEQVSTGVGARYAMNAWVTKNAFAGAGYFEWGTAAYKGDWNGAWYDASATYTLEKRMTFGVRGRRAVGIGPLAQVNIPEIHTKLWLLWAAADPERNMHGVFKTGLTGATFDF